ncbi:hypothetical protein [Acidipropionibacterium virtanenii]|uniref:hypothetical protein n=1 Tax=Acidipropionibacterium virtanenii TaxID=2057246 RepID=UPI001C68B853|nr:hypothetical protein [Acidipropionibacterium virtanenii]
MIIGALGCAADAPLMPRVLWSGPWTVDAHTVSLFSDRPSVIDGGQYRVSDGWFEASTNLASIENSP